MSKFNEWFNPFDEKLGKASKAEAIKHTFEYQQKKIDQLQKENGELKEAYREIPICKCSSWADVHVIDKSIKTNNHHRKCEQYKEQEGE